MIHRMCQFCGGTGKVSLTVLLSNPPQPGPLQPCPMCEGRGYHRSLTEQASAAALAAAQQQTALIT